MGSHDIKAVQWAKSKGTCRAALNFVAESPRRATMVRTVMAIVGLSGLITWATRHSANPTIRYSLRSSPSDEDDACIPLSLRPRQPNFDSTPRDRGTFYVD
ncbi:unnamed protein product [Scytosiphon promiscuus]